MAVQQGVGVELELRGDKAKTNIQDVIGQLELLEQKVRKVNSSRLTLGSKANGQNLSQIQDQLEQLSRKTDATTKKITKAVGTAAGKSIGETRKFREHFDTEMDRVSRSAEKAARKTENVFIQTGRTISNIGALGENLTNSVLQISRALVAPIRSVFSTAKTFVSNTVSEGVDQIKKLELAEVGLQNHFKNDRNFNIAEYIQRIRKTAETTQGLSAGDLADYISQLAPLTQGNSEQAYAAAMGALKIIRYGGGDTTVDMMSIIKNIRDVQAKGKAYQMDLNQFNRAAPLLATMLEQQGMGGLVKRTDSGALTLNITKENADDLVAAFANLNNNRELNRVFNEMQNTLSGILEQTKQSLQNDVIDLLKYQGESGKSLLDIAKSWIGETGKNNSDFRMAMREGLQSIAGRVADLLSSIDIGDVITTAFDGLAEFGAYAKDELLPITKEIVGVDKEASPTEVIKGLIRLVVKYGKSFIDGIKSFLSVISFATNSLKKVFGEGNLVSFIGWVTGFNKLGWSLVQTLGTILNGIGHIPQFLSSAKNSVLQLTGALSKISKVLGGGGGFIGGLGTGLTGIGLANLVADGVFNDNTAHNKQFSNSVNALTAGVGVGLMTGSPVLGVVSAGVSSLVKYIWDMGKDISAIRDKYLKSDEANLNEVQQRIYDQIIKELADGDKPAYQAGDNASEYGAAKLKEWLAGNITGNETEAELYRKILDARGTYLWQKKYRQGGNTLLSIANSYLADGETQLTKDNASTAQNAENLKKYWNKLKEHGFVQQFEGWNLVDDNQTGDNIWTFLTGKGISEVGSVEGLQKLADNLGEIDKALSAIDGQDAKLQIEVATDNGNEGKVAEAMTSYMKELGFERESIDGKQVWATDVLIRDALEAGKVDGAEQGFSYARGQEMGYKWNASHRPSLNDSQQATLGRAFSINAGDLMPQWQGADQQFVQGKLSDEDRINYDASLDQAIGNAIARIQLGGKLDDETAQAVVWALEHRNGNWGEVIKMWGEQPALLLAHGLNNVIGEETGVAVAGLVELLSNKLYNEPLPTLSITGSGIEDVKNALFGDKDNHVALLADGANSLDSIWENLRKRYAQVQSLYRAGGGYIAPVARKPKPLFFNWGGSARGVDTVPAMLRPGEFVERATAVNKAGLGVMNALNEGDLSRAYKLLGAKLNTTNTNTYDGRRYNTTDSHNTTTNNFRFFNNSQSAVRTSYRGLRNIMALR